MTLGRTSIILGSVLVLGLLLYFLGVMLTNSQGPFLRSRYLAGPLPNSPDSKQWDQASPIILALSGQILTEPLLATPSVKSLTVRSLHNEQDIAFLLEWLDSTRNDELTPGSFRDAAALAFPIGETFAFSCMGRADSSLNIWHWKADWQADIDHVEARKRRRDRPWRDPLIPRRASSIEELVAEGVDSFISKRRQGYVQGQAIWEQDRWRVVFRRPMDVRSDSTNAEFHPGEDQVISFAIWNGQVKERGSQKAVGPWVRVIIDTGSEPTSSSELEEAEAIAEQVGLVVGDIDAELQKELNLNTTQGVVIFEVFPGSMAGPMGSNRRRSSLKSTGGGFRIS